MDAQQCKKILVLGDSLSAAYKLPKEQGWVFLLQRRIQREGLAVELVNASVSGATTAAGLQILPQALAQHQPDMVVLELGANDGLQGKPVAYIRQNLERLITLVKQAEAQPVLLGIRLPPNFGARYTEPFFEQYPSLAKQFQITLLPFLLEGVAGDPDLMMEDGLHPSAAGQQRIMENVWAVLAPLLQHTRDAAKGACVTG